MKNVMGLLCVLLVAQACSTGSTGGTAVAAPAAGCTEIQNPDGPLVCVDDSVHPPKLSAYGKDLHVHSKLASGGYVHVTWKTSSGTSLDMKVDPASSGEKCFKSQFKKTCSGDTCSIKVNPGAARKQCDYNIWANGEKADPVIIVEEWPFVPPVSSPH